MPEYHIRGNDITVKFVATERSHIALSKTPNRHESGLEVGLDAGLEKKVMDLIARNAKVTMAEIAETLNVNKRSVERIVKRLREDRYIVRKNGKRYGYWEINNPFAMKRMGDGDKFD